MKKQSWTWIISLLGLIILAACSSALPDAAQEDAAVGDGVEAVEGVADEAIAPATVADSNTEAPQADSVQAVVVDTDTTQLQFLNAYANW